MLIISGLVVVFTGATFFAKRIFTVRQVIHRCGVNEEEFSGQLGVICLKLLPDGGKTCTAGSQCLSGDCVVNQPQAEKGICYKYENKMPCLDGYTTIEDARNYPKNELIVDNIWVGSSTEKSSLVSFR